MQINKRNYPAIAKAFRLIEEDNGGHLIGTVYPGEKLDLESFDVPDEHAPKLDAIERALQRILPDAERFNTFVVGEESEHEAVMTTQGDLTDAHELLCAYFMGWEIP